MQDHATQLREISSAVDIIKALAIKARNEPDPTVALWTVSRQLDTLTAASDRDWIAEHEIVQSLYYDAKSVRHELIPEAHRTTFNWLLEEESPKQRRRPQQPKTTLLKWLRAGSGTYWISGKPGSRPICDLLRTPSKSTRNSVWGSTYLGALVSWFRGQPAQPSPQGGAQGKPSLLQ